MLWVLFGDFGKIVDVWCCDLIRVVVLIEVIIDFVDEDVFVDVIFEVNELFDKIVEKL